MVISLIIYWYANKSRRNYVMYNVMGIKEKLMDSFYKRGISKYNDNDDSAGAVHSYCQLPYSCFDEFVSGAVDMYIT